MEVPPVLSKGDEKRQQDDKSSCRFLPSNQRASREAPMSVLYLFLWALTILAVATFLYIKHRRHAHDAVQRPRVTLK